MKKIRELWKKLWFEIRMYEMDARWRMFEYSCWEMYPPSFYHRYPPEERKEIMDRDFKRLREMIAELYN